MRDKRALIYFDTITDRRAKLVERLKRALGLASNSELMRRLVDQEGRRLRSKAAAK